MLIYLMKASINRFLCSAKYDLLKKYQPLLLMNVINVEQKY